MKVLWANGPCSGAEIVQTLIRADPSRHPKTIKTFLGRLVTKKAVTFRRERRGYLYRALVAENQCLKAVADNFLERVFGGSLTPMLAYFVEHRKLTAEEIQELKRVLEKKP